MAYGINMKKSPNMSIWKKRNSIELPYPADPLGYTSEEISAICKKKKISLEKFNKAFGVNVAK